MRDQEVKTVDTVELTAEDAAILKELEGTEEAGTEDTALALRSGTQALGCVSGDIEISRDMKLPRLNIAYGVGGLAENFAPGDLVLDSEYRLVPKNQPLTVVVLSAFQYWKEWLNKDAFDAGLRPRRFSNVKEVLASKGTIEWSVDGRPPTFSKAMDLRLLIEQPEGIMCSLFGLDLEGKKYSPAVWTVDKTAYSGIGPVILNANAMILRERGIMSGRWELRTEVKVTAKRTATIPKIRLSGANSQGFVDEVTRLFSGASVSEAADAQ